MAIAGVIDVNRGDIHDLTFRPGSLFSNTKSNIAYHLDCTSDYLPLLIIICYKTREALPSNFKLKTLDTVLFHRLLSISVNLISLLLTYPIENDLDTLAGELIIKAVHTSYSRVVRRSYDNDKKNLWKNFSWKLARQKFRSSNWAPASSEALVEAKKAYRKVIRKVKNKFFQAKIENAQTSKDNFIKLNGTNQHVSSAQTNLKIQLLQTGPWLLHIRKNRLPCPKSTH